MFCYSAFRRRLLAFIFQPPERPGLILSFSLLPLIIFVAKVDILTAVARGRINYDDGDFRKYRTHTRGESTRGSVTVKITWRNVRKSV